MSTWGASAKGQTSILERRETCLVDSGERNQPELRQIIKSQPKSTSGPHRYGSVYPNKEMVIGKLAEVGGTQSSHLVRASFSRAGKQIMLEGCQQGLGESTGSLSNLEKEDAIALCRVIPLIDAWQAC